MTETTTEKAIVIRASAQLEERGPDAARGQTDNAHRPSGSGKSTLAFSTSTPRGSAGRESLSAPVSSWPDAPRRGLIGGMSPPSASTSRAPATTRPQSGTTTGVTTTCGCSSRVGIPHCTAAWRSEAERPGYRDYPEMEPGCVDAWPPGTARRAVTRDLEETRRAGFVRARWMASSPTWKTRSTWTRSGAHH